MRSLDLPNHGACRALTEVVAELFPAAAGRLPRRRVAAGETLYREGDGTDRLYLVESGLIRTERLGAGGEAVPFASLSGGDLVGELCFCTVRARQESAHAVRDAVLVVLSADDLVELASRDRDALIGVLEALCHRVDTARRHLGELGFESGERRVALRLLELARSEGMVVQPGVLALVDRPTQASLAAAAFVSREFANRVLNELRGAGLVAYERTGPVTAYETMLAAHLVSTKDARGSL